MRFHVTFCVLERTSLELCRLEVVSSLMEANLLQWADVLKLMNVQQGLMHARLLEQAAVAAVAEVAELGELAQLVERAQLAEWAEQAEWAVL